MCCVCPRPRQAYYNWNLSCKNSLGVKADICQLLRVKNQTDWKWTENIDQDMTYPEEKNKSALPQSTLAVPHLKNNAIHN